MATKAQRRLRIENRLKAMQHPLRRAILLYFTEHDLASPTEVAAALGEEIPNVSHHMKQLVKFNCAELVKEEKVRGAVKHYYRNVERHLIDTDEWEDLDPITREGLLVDFMQPTVDDFTTSVRAGMLGSDARFHITRTPMAGMDRQGQDELMEAHRRCFEEGLEIQARSAARRAKSGEPAISISSSQGCFEVPSF